MYLTQLVPTDFVHWAVFPHALARMEAFARKYEGEHIAIQLVELVSRMWATNDAGLAVIVVSPDKFVHGHFVGHMLCKLEKMNDELYAHIWQAEVDQEYASSMSQRFMEKGLGMAIEWAKKQGVKKVRMITRRPPEPFIRKYGWDYEQTILTKTWE